MNQELKEILIHQLEEELKAAKKIDTQEIADIVHNIGFQCLMCGKCCRRKFGDNRVAITPGEIREIEKGCQLPWDEIAEPLNIETESLEEECRTHESDGMIDENGNIHTFGWMLHRKNNCDCSFIPDDITDNRCGIYKLRPFLCSTYPFYIERLELQTSECEGLGKEISSQESFKIADLVIKRCLCELQDTILTYQNYNSFTTGKNGQMIAVSGLKQGYLNYIVHNSEGSYKIIKMIKITT